MPVPPSPVVTYLEHGVDFVVSDADTETTLLVRAVDRLLAHADAPPSQAW